MDKNLNPSSDLCQAISDLWKLRPPDPKNLLSAPAFIRLRETCQRLYFKECFIKLSVSGLDFALHRALRSLGLPAWLTDSAAHLVLPVEIAAAQLDAAFHQSESRRTHLCPLNCADADDFPTLKFGPVSVRMMSAADLETLVDAQRLKRFDPSWRFDSKRFSEFGWLIVKEVIPIDGVPSARFPGFFSDLDLDRDLGAIEPHPRRFPIAVEDALFALLQAPWEDWVEDPDILWPGFKMPWVYTVTDDIFRRPTPPPSPDSLSWEPDFYMDRYEQEVEYERPVRFPINEQVSEAHVWLNDAAWSDLTRARQSPLFESPIAHFLVRAFLSDGIDEFLAHILVIEAALGLPIDAKRRPKLQGNPGATDRVAARLSALLGSNTAGDDFKKLFDLRNEFVHGRAMSPITSPARIGFSPVDWRVGLWKRLSRPR